MSCCEESCGEEEYTHYKRTREPETGEQMYIKNFRKKSKAGIATVVVLILILIFIYSVTITRIVVVLFGIYVVVNAYIVSLRDDQGVE